MHEQGKYPHVERFTPERMLQFIELAKNEEPKNLPMKIQ